MQISKKYIKIILVGILLTIISLPYAPTSLNCAQGRPSICSFVTNIILIAGGMQVLKSEIKNKLFSSTSVQVQLDTGETRQGKLSYKATEGRKVATGDKVRLNCQNASESVEKSGNKLCELEFLGFDPNSPCLRGSPCYGKIPSWSIQVDNQGTPDPELLKFQ